MRRRTLLGRFALVLAAVLAFCGTTPAAEERGVDALGREYWLYLPDPIVPQRRYTLVVGVHPYGGTGRYAGGLAGWVRERDDVIVVGPSFPNDGYQVLERRSAEQLVALFASLKKRFRLRDKLFIAGFSGGAQFAHRFAIRHPELVAGCAAHSGGSWAVGGRATMFGREIDLLQPSAAAAHVPFAISCGEADPRVKGTKQFAALAAEQQYVLVAKYWPGVGHALCADAQRLTAECFLLAAGAAAKAEETIARAESELAAGRPAAAITGLEAAKATPAPDTEIGQRFTQRLTARLTLRVAAIVRAGLDAVAQAKDAATLRALAERYQGVAKVTDAAGAALQALEK
jgi:predicted esterase